MKKLFIAAISLMLMALKLPDRKISGIVVDETGKPIYGASVVNSSKTVSTITDVNGSFELKVSSTEKKLMVSYIGYELEEIELKKDSILRIVLKQRKETLDEVVVIGYGKQWKKDITGSVAYLHASPTTNPTFRTLSGKVAGICLQDKTAMHKSQCIVKEEEDEVVNREGYDRVFENRFLKVSDNPLSTFSIDVDAASYTNVRRIIKQGNLPPQGAVRIEEFINYFSYKNDQPSKNDPFNVNTEIADCPWNKTHQILMIGLQGKKIETDKLPASNLTFLIDVSGSMFSPDKLPLVKSSLKLLVDQLRINDRISIVVYAGNAGLVLPPTSGKEKMIIKQAIDNLEAGGSTAGGAGIKLAYKTAQQNFIKGGNNRVILCTDGDFNVGASSDDELERLIEEERETGVFLTVLGFGTGNYQDAKMQKLADKGNGNHYYIDGINEAKKVMVAEFGATLFTIAKDVKLQIEFNASIIKGYRLIGYENRMLAKEDFNNDKKDAGDLGSGHTVTALYEIIPANTEAPELDRVDALKYTKQNKRSYAMSKLSKEAATIKLRYKVPDTDVSKLLQITVDNKKKTFDQASENLRFASAVASFGMLLQNSQFKGNSSFASIRKIVEAALGKDEEGYRKEFLLLIDETQRLSDKKDIAQNK